MPRAALPVRRGRAEAAERAQASGAGGMEGSERAAAAPGAQPRANGCSGAAHGALRNGYVRGLPAPHTQVCAAGASATPWAGPVPGRGGSAGKVEEFVASPHGAAAAGGGKPAGCGCWGVGQNLAGQRGSVCAPRPASEDPGEQPWSQACFGGLRRAGDCVPG